MVRLVATLCVLAAFVGIVSVSAAINADRVNSLPGFNGALPSRQFSGYLDVGAGRHLHYWFSESTRSPATDPLVIWMNGGPGCSSMDGFFYEMGPFRFVEPHPKNDTPRLQLNEYAWTTQSNMIFLEAPACVGLSYADTSAGCHNNDTQQSVDNLQALRQWYQGYPEYRSNALYITGESYAGVYVPTLALQILTNEPSYNLKGIMVGNGVVGNSGQDHNKLSVEYLHGNGLYSTQLYNQINQACGSNMRQPSPQCEALLDQMGDAVGHVNIYDIFGPCINDGFPPSSGKRYRRPLEGNEWLARLGGPDACLDAGAATVYLNIPAVRQAINAKPISVTGPWEICTDRLAYDVIQPSLLPVYRDQLIPRIKVLIYNGQGDACVPWNNNEEWTSSLGLKTIRPWHSWLVDKQVAGYVTEYVNGFSFLTVKAAGHMVPQTHPTWALSMFDRFVNNKPW